MDKYKIIIKFLLVHHVGELDFRKLCIMLFFIDKDYYAKHEKTLTSDSYIKASYGPEPKQINKVLNELKNEGCIRVTNYKKSGEIVKKTLKFIKICDDDSLNNYLKSNKLDELEYIINILYEYNQWSVKRLITLSCNSHVYHGLNKGNDIPGSILPSYFYSKITDVNLDMRQFKY